MAYRRTLFDLEIAVRASRTLRGIPLAARPVDVFLCLVDHFEPRHGGAPESVARGRVEDWLHRYPEVASRHSDWDGRVPSHSFFYPWDEYDPWELDRIGGLCARGFGEVELHLHHRDDTEETLRAKLKGAVRVFRSHGLLADGPDGAPVFGFIHGNWALDNSRRDGTGNYCGVNSELTVLREEGCYADFTFPAWQCMAQPRLTNAIYYAVDDPVRPKSHDRGIAAATGQRPPPDSLLLIQGPLVPYAGRRKGIPVPAIDDGDIACYRRFTPERLERWLRAGIHVRGRPDRIFIKLHCHGAADRNRETMLGEDLDLLFTEAERSYNDGRRFRLHYLTAREMYNVVKATEAGVEDLAAARDFLIKPPRYSALKP